jgi:hypothetical protein
VEALALRGGKIVYAGADARALVGPGTRVVDLGGRTILPGFIDSHIHPLTSGVALGECSLSGLETVEKVLEKIRLCAKDAPAGWIRGGGWELPLFPDSNPGKALLDDIVPDRPVYLDSSDGHSAWVNSKALEAAGITEATPDPPGGRIERDSSTGEPSGVLREEAMALVEGLLPEHSREELLEGARRALRMAARFGITTLYEASADEESLGAYAELERRGQLTARINAAFTLEPSSGIPDLEGLRERYQGKLLRLTGGKVFADGVMETRTAAMLEPYADRGGLGTALWSQGALNDAAAALDRRGF